MDEKYAYQIPEGVDPHAWIVAQDFKTELQVVYYLARGSCYMRDYIHYMQARWSYSESKIRADLNKLKKWGLIRFVDAKKVKGSKYSYLALTNKGILYTKGISSKKSVLPSQKAIANRNQLTKSKALLFVDRCDRENGMVSRIPLTYKANNRVDFIAEHYCKRQTEGQLKIIREYFLKTDAKLFYLRDLRLTTEGTLVLYCMAITESENELDVFVKVNKWIDALSMATDKINPHEPYILDLVVVTTKACDAIQNAADRLVGKSNMVNDNPYETRAKIVGRIMDLKNRRDKGNRKATGFAALDILSKIDIDDPRTSIRVVALNEI